MFAPRNAMLVFTHTTSLLGLLLFVGCAAAPPTAVAKPEIVPSHVYPLPLDTVLAQAKTLLEKQGWRVKRAGTALLTNWQGSEGGAIVTYRVYGERLDTGLSSIRVERAVATPVQFILDHPKTARPWFQKEPPPYPAEFEENPIDVGAVGTAPPTTMAVTERRRDPAMEFQFQKEIDPLFAEGTGRPDPPSAAKDAPVDAGVLVGLSGTASSDARAGGAATTGARPLKSLSGIWEGIFVFRGNVTGSYTGEVTVAVDDGSAEVADFCPEGGGTFTAKGSSVEASWHGDLACPAIQLEGCNSTVIKYSFANAVLSGSTLRLVAAGSVDTPPGCGETNGALSVIFEATQAQYLYLNVSRTNERTTCDWPSDWEDFGSTGSMAMPSTSMDEKVFLGIIRAKRGRLADIERLLRRCHHRVQLHGVAVLMQMAVTGPHQSGLH